MRKWLYIGLLFGLLCSPLALYAQEAPIKVASGYCGDGENYENVTWTVYSNDSLSIVGTGAMGSNSNGEGYNNFESDLRQKVRTVYFSDGLTYIGRYALSYLSNLAYITVDPKNEFYDSRDNCNCLIETGTKTLLFTSLNCFIPDGVEILRDYAISDAYGITSIRIPRSVKQMGESAPPTNRSTPFVTLTMKDIWVEWETEEELPKWMMNNPSIMYAYNITLHVPCGTEEMYSKATPWKTCKAIEKHGCCEIDGGDCSDAGDESIIWSYDECGTLWIRGVGKMKQYETPQARPWAQYSNYIDSIAIEEGITSLGTNAFHGLFKVHAVHIPKSVTHIGRQTFGMCYLDDIYVHGEEEVLNFAEGMPTEGFESVVPTLHVPCPMEENYRTAEGWKDYTIVTDYDETYTVTAKVNDTIMGEVTIEPIQE